MLKNRRGQFQILAAFLVISILSASVMTSFYRTQENSRVEPVIISNTISEVNGALYKLLGFATGYFSSIMKITGDYDYAQKETATYLDGGLKNIAQSHPDWGVTFTYSPSELTIDADWYNYKSYTKGEWNIEYSIPTIGLEGIKLKTITECSASIIKTEKRPDSTYWSNVYVTMDDHPNLQLSLKNFQFFKYDSVKRTWQSIGLTSEPVLTTDGIYHIQIPTSTIDPEVYFIQVEDQRGIISQSGFIQGDPIAGGWSNKSEMSYTYSIEWGDPNPFIGLKDIFTLELLQNGTIRWLGGRLPVKTNFNLMAEKPLPPISVKSLRVSKSINNGLTWQPIPFQVEDWASDYAVPQGITNSKTIFNENCMIVFQINHNYTNIKVGWDGKSSSQPVLQTSPFTDNTSSRTLNNGVIKLTDNLSASKKIDLTIPPSGADASVSTTFFRFNDPTKITNDDQTYGSGSSFVITNGIVRDILQQEPEWNTGSGGGGINGSPDTLAHIVITLPAGTTYYTYKLRTIFLDTALSRILTELSAISIDPSIGVTRKTENGLDVSNNPIISPVLEYYGGNDGAGVHRWSELVDDSTGKGAGIMMNNATLSKLYEFDAPPVYRGCVRNDGTKIEVNLVKNGAATNPFPNRKDITLNGAVVLFDGSNKSQIFTPSNTPALSLMVDEPPSFIISLGTMNAPGAVNDAYTTIMSTQLIVNAVQGVLANDYDPNSDPIAAIKVTDPLHGVLNTFASNGSFTYTPTAGYVGTDSFTYKANDGTFDSNTAKVTLKVTAPNQAPIADNDSYATSMNNPIVANAIQGVLANDHDPDIDPITAIKETDPSHGVLTAFASNGSFTYTPTAGYVGSDSFTYKANDGLLDSNIATVTITVNPALAISVTPAGPLTMIVGQTQTFTAAVSGGTGARSYQWYLNGAVISGQTGLTYTYTATLGTHSIYVRVTDSASPPVIVQSNSVSVTAVNPITVTLRPNNPGSTTELNAQGVGSANWDRVNEVTADGSNTYVRGTVSAVSQTDTYNIPDQSLTGSITNVRIYIRAKESQNNNNVYAWTAMRLGVGSIQYGTQISTSDSWTNYYTNYATKTGNLGTGAWTWADINNLQIGVQLQSRLQGGDMRYAECTQVWVEVTYIPS